MDKYCYNHNVEINLLNEIFGEKAVMSCCEKNTRKRNAIIRTVMEMLPTAKRKIILYKYGFTDGHIHTTRQTAERLGISQEVIRQTEIFALRTLRSPACSKALRTLLFML